MRARRGEASASKKHVILSEAKRSRRTSNILLLLPDASWITNYFVYLLTDKGRHTLYIGVTNDLPTRLYQHRNPEQASFTQRYHCIILLYTEHYPDVNAAIVREKQIKGWTRAKKNALVKKVNPRWEDLSADWV